MNCAQARFLLYAYLDRDISSVEADALSRHLTECPPCAARARSARGLAEVLRSRMTRSQAPIRLRLRLREGETAARRFRYPLLATAAVVLFLLVPLVADVSGRRSLISSPAFAVAAGASIAGTAVVGARSASLATPDLVTRHMTGTLVCLECEARIEAGLCPLPEARHEAAFCADNGEVWRLMSHDPSFTQRSAGQTVTVDGVGFPRSGFLRASRVGY
ncbi:MAG: zf-HC2 domain-containing protein [Acidobacteriota bacterium]|nr:zf-HC2 domain-containing protein [Acidobacteriota bacterium]